MNKNRFITMILTVILVFTLCLNTVFAAAGGEEGMNSEDQMGSSAFASDAVPAVEGEQTGKAGEDAASSLNTAEEDGAADPAEETADDTAADTAEENADDAAADTAAAEDTAEETAEEKMVPMYRMYNPNSGEHFYTALTLERNKLVEVGWYYEGIGWYAPVSSDIPVYRVYNPNAGDHHYTTNVDEKNMLIVKGWKDEGIGWYSAAEDRIPIYRQYNPNAKTGTHNYTANHAEAENLIGVGWRDEGIGWYALAGGKKDGIDVGEYNNSEEDANHLTITTSGNGTYIITLNNASKDIESLQFPVWSEENGQDDISWLTAEKQEDGTWQAKVTGKAFKSAGTINVHAHAMINGGSAVVASATFEVDDSQIDHSKWFVADGMYRYMTEDGEIVWDSRPYLFDLFGTKTVNGQTAPATPGYFATVDRERCLVTIYTKYPGTSDWNLPVCAFKCSPGVYGMDTDAGYWNTLAKYRWQTLMGPSYGQYCTRIHGGELFHSVACGAMNDHNLDAGTYNNLGTRQSHGCVRLCVRNAYWIYTFCQLGMTVRVGDYLPAPMDAVPQPKMLGESTVDPTDPAYTGNYEYTDTYVYYGGYYFN